MKFTLSKKTYTILFALMIVLMLITFYIEKKYSPSVTTIPFESDYAQSSIMMAKKSVDDAKGRMFFKGEKPKDGRVFETEAIKLVKEKNFDDVAEKPKDPFTQLAEMARTKNRTFVNLKETDLNKKVFVSSGSFDDMKIKEYDVMSSSSNLSMIYAPCDFMVFKTSSSWKHFSDTYKIRESIDVDFSKENAVVILSKSDLPPGIFKIAGVSYEGDEAFIDYRVDVFEMADNNKDAMTNFYSAVAVSKKAKSIKLRQIR